MRMAPPFFWRGRGLIPTHRPTLAGQDVAVPAPRFPVNPAVVRWARETAGYSVEDVARRLQVAPERVAEWESGDRQPTQHQVGSLAWMLRRTPAFFLRSGPPTADTPRPPDFRSASHRGEPSIELLREVRLAVERRSLYLGLHDDEPAPFHLDVDAQDPARAAEQVRDLFGIDVDDQRRARDAYQSWALWAAAVEACDVLVFQSSSFDVDEARGVAVSFDVLPIIIVNAKDPAPARTFTLLHEFFHLVTGTGSLCDLVGRSSITSRAERACNQFAANALMPASAVREIVGQLPAPDAVAAMVRAFRVSEHAAAIRLRELGGITEAEVDLVEQDTARRVAERAASTSSPRIPHYRRRLRDLGRTYVGSVLDAYEADQLTLTDVSQYLDVKVPHIAPMRDALASGAETDR